MMWTSEPAQQVLQDHRIMPQEVVDAPPGFIERGVRDDRRALDRQALIVKPLGIKVLFRRFDLFDRHIAYRGSAIVAAVLPSSDSGFVAGVGGVVSLSAATQRARSVHPSLMAAIKVRMSAKVRVFMFTLPCRARPKFAPLSLRPFSPDLQQVHHLLAIERG